MKKLITVILLIAISAGATSTYLRYSGGQLVVVDGVIQTGAGSSGWTDPNTANLVAIYYMQETNGTTTYVDSWTNDFNGTPQPSSSTGPTATNLGARVNGGDEIASVFDGTDDYISLPNLGMGGTNPFSVCCWMKSSYTATGTKTPWYWGVNTAYNKSVLSINTLTSRSLYYAIKNASVYTGSGVWATNVWNHIAVTYSGGALSTTSLKIYVNGIQQSTTLSGSGTPNFTDSNYMIGNDGATSGRNFPGQLDGVRYYNKVLTSNEIFNAYYTNTLHPTKLNRR